MNCILRAVLLTQMTSDTSYGTCLHDILALILGAALYNVLCLVRNKLDQMLRTCSNTFSTCLTYFLVNLRNAVHDMNRIKRTSLYTAAVSKASVITGLRSAVRHECHGCTVLVAGILVIASCLLTGSRTLYKCYLALAFLGCHTHDLTDLGCNRRAADRTLIDRSLALCDCCCQTGTTGITTATTVISRKHT